MKMFDKIKDLFTDEVEVEEEEPVKKEVIQVEIPAPKGHATYEEAEKEEVVEEKTSPFFDDVDFDDIKRSNPTLEEIDDKYEPLYEPTYSKPAYTANTFKKEDKKRFEPTPIISPVYGVLDKNYRKDDIIDKGDTPKSNRDITIDDVRNKAYGTLEDELESTLFGKTSIMFQTNTHEELQEIEKDLEETADTIDMLNEEEPKHSKKETTLEDEILEQPVVENKEDISESDLFNLIDDMYGKGDI